jgi:hypothetical protein
MTRSTYPFRGGPWDGFIIEYAERALPEDPLSPSRAHPPGLGLYHLNADEAAYVWTVPVRVAP